MPWKYTLEVPQIFTFFTCKLEILLFHCVCSSSSNFFWLPCKIRITCLIILNKDSNFPCRYVYQISFVNLMRFSTAISNVNRPGFFVEFIRFYWWWLDNLLIGSFFPMFSSMVRQFGANLVPTYLLSIVNKLVVIIARLFMSCYN